MRGLCATVLVLGAGWAMAAAPDRVALVITGPADAAAQLRSSVTELLGRLQLTPEGTGAPLATVTVDLGDERTQIEVKDKVGAVVNARALQRRPTLALTVEEAAYVIQSSVEALADLERNPPGEATPTPTPLPAPATPPLVSAEPVAPVAKTAAPHGPRFELGAMMTGRGFSSSAWGIFGGGLLGTLQPWPGTRWSPRLTVDASYNTPISGSVAALQLSTQTVSLRVTAGLRLAGESRWSLEGLLGVGVDLLFTSGSSSLLPPKLFTHDRVDASPILSAGLSVHHRLTPANDLFLSATAELDLLPHRYVFDLAGDQVTLFAAWRVHPALQLGFSFALPGGGGS